MSTNTAQNDLDTAVVTEAKERFKRCTSWEDQSRKLFLDDLKFSNGDSDNGYQWPDALRKSRDFDAKPCLTINKTFQHNLLIINDIRQNMPGADVHPVGGEGTYESAMIYEGCIRHIEYQSNAKQAYATACEHQVQGGIGYWRIVTDYVDDMSFDQEIYLRRIKDALMCMLDPDCKEFDGSDAEYGFVFCDYVKDDFARKYPEYKTLMNTDGIGDGDDWVSEDNVRVVEYYRKEYEPDELWAIPDAQTGDYRMIKLSELKKGGDDLVDEARSRAGTKMRKVRTPHVMWYLLAGQYIIDETEIPCQYIPIVRCVGWETVIDGKLDRKGHTRQLKDPQRMYNFWASGAVEHVALQGKQPYIGDLRSFEGLEKYWENANKENYAYLPYNGVDDDGSPIPPPQRQQPPVMAQGYIQGLQNAANEMAMVSGQYQNQFGAPGPEEAGVAIQARRRQGGVSTFHFSDNFATAVRFSTKILIDMIPRVYDTKRVINIMAEDSSISQITIDPVAKQGVSKNQIDGQKAAIIFNPKVGKYDVVAEAGPNYQTRREEAFSAMSNIIAQNPELMKVCGDLLFKAGDFPMSDEIAERFARTIPDAIRTGTPNPQVAQLQQQVQQLQQLLDTAQKALKEKAEKTDVEEYRAASDRLKMLLDHEALDPREAKAVIQHTVAQILEGVLPLPPVAPAQGNPSPQTGAPPSPGSAMPSP